MNVFRGPRAGARSGASLGVRGLVKGYGDLSVLTGLDLDVAAGTVTAVLGPSGCGKTTLLRTIAGFERADGGTVALDGIPVTGDRLHVPPERRHIGVVAQEGGLFPHLDVARNVAFGLDRAARRAGRVDRMLELVGLSGLGRRLPHQLSGGQQQRVALARALAPSPALVLLDEPFTALDAGLRASMREDVLAALHAAGTTALLVTHDQTEALSLADQVAVMRGGRLVQTADPATLYRDPVDPQVATFLGTAVLLPAHVTGGFAQCALGRIPLRAGSNGVAGPATVMLRPEQIVCRVEGPGLDARVVDITYYGHDALVVLALAGAQPVRVTCRITGGSIPAVGDRVHLEVHGDAVAYAVDPVRPADPADAAGADVPVTTPG